jgi:hypothetical protein
MPLARMLAVVDDLVRAQIGPGPAPRAARAFGPQLLSGRGRGIRTLDDYVDALARVEEQVGDRQELIGRLRLGTRPGVFGELFRARSAWLTTPDWYWAGGDDNDELSRSWEALATAGYLDVDRELGRPRELVAVWPLWLALDSVSQDAYYATLLVGQDDPPELRWPGDYVTWAGGLARAWAEWNRWRRVSHGGRPVAEWAAAESTPIDQGPLRRAIARLTPLEDVRGFLDAMVLAAMALAAPDQPVSELLAAYYAEPSAPPAQPHVSERTARFFESSSFRGLSSAGTLTEDDLRTLARAVAPAALRRLSRSRSEREDEAATPWGQAALELVADQFAAFLAGTAGPLGGWPTGGFGARQVGPQGTTQPLYGGWDLQFNDSDAALRFAGVVRAGDPGGHVAALVTDLRSLGFTAPAAGTASFDARVAMAVREFQIEASQGQLSALRGGVRVVAPAVRRFLGHHHGIVDAETRRLLQLWLDLPRVQGEPAEHQAEAGVSQARNALLVVACAFTPPTLMASQVVAGDVWGPMGTPPANGRDTFDFAVEDRRHWAVDRLQRWGPPVAADAPRLDDFGGGVVPLRDVDVVPLGRHHSVPTGADAFDIGGPQMFKSDHWTTTRLTLARFRQHPRPGVPVRDDDWPVLYGMTNPETYGYADVPNAWDRALLSLGWCHWTLVVGASDGELGALLAWYRWRDPEAFDADFARWGVAAEDWPTTRLAPGKYVASVLLHGVRSGGIAVPFRAARPGAADAYLYHTWLRSWRVLYRVAQPLRRSDGLHAAAREFAVRRIWEVLNHAWTGTVQFTTAATLGQLFTSQRAVVALLRWHINLPGLLFGDGPAFAVQPRLNGAVNAADAAYRAAQPIGAARIDASTLSDPASDGAIDFQKALIARLTANMPVPDTVKAKDAIDTVLPDGTHLDEAPGSYAGPAPVGTYP